jgi:two-component system, LytTR family, sensor kinase
MKSIESPIREHAELRRGPSSLYLRVALAMLLVSVGLAAISAYGCHIFLATSSGPVPLVPSGPSIAYGLAKWLWWGVIAFGMWLIAQRVPRFLEFSPKSILLQLLIGSVVCVVHLPLVQVAWRGGLHWNAWQFLFPSSDYLTLSSFGRELTIYGLLFGFSGFLHLQTQRQTDVLLKLELEKQLSEAQLKALQMQMEPHFLFNTLNAITSLVAQGRNQEAMKTLAHLNTILRTTLERKSPQKVPFAEELRVIESYLAIQKVRFAGRLQVRIEASEDALDGLVPCFLLQPIVENAIQHGIAPKAAGGFIETHVKRVGDTLWMQVKDNGRGPGNSETKGHGIGMQNTRERLAYFYPDNHEFRAIGSSRRRLRSNHPNSL